MTLLIVEDEKKLAEIERDYLVAAGFNVEMLHDGSEVASRLAVFQPELIVLDLMLPGKDGLTICREVRQNTNIPIIMTTAKVEEVDRLIGLELGADDYLCKPFSPRELVARVRAVLRRAQPQLLQPTELTIVAQTNKVKYNDRKIELTSVEFKLLEELMNRPGVILSRDHLMNHIYPDGRIVSDRTIDSHIKKLRKKLDTFNAEHEFIRSVYGAGYKYE